ncbi:MAG: C4-dicarboxylate ABC transporter permease [Rhizobiaceae bacterium MnEN-MB40S]|nr:MAG: C4-dicarboxylate ABC transporter permease [Rhizobiaceae bacterium MnEN-MB40S]
MATTDTRTESDDTIQSLRSPVAVIGLLWIAFQITVWLRPETSIYVIRAGHACFGLATFFALFTNSKSALNRIIGIAGIIMSAVPVIIYQIEQERLVTRYAGLADLEFADITVAIILGTLLLFATIKKLGVGMVVVVGAFVAYQLAGGLLPRPFGHKQTDLTGFVDQQFLTIDGLLGIPLGVSVNIIFYFILFATIFEVYGGSRMIIQLALALTGRYAGGPAKAAVVGSAVTGLVSGSAVANVMTSGMFTIPLMIRGKYQPKIAAAIEAVVSTGGQLVPPVMGAAAFIMADFLQMPYREIVVAAIFPAFFYFFAMFLTVHFQARASGIGATDPTDIDSPWQVLRHRGHLLLPLGWLAGRISFGYPIPYSCVESIIGVIVVGTLFPHTRISLRDLLLGAAEVGVRAMPVALACALAGVIVGVVSYTGLGNKLTSIIVDVSDASVVLALVLTIMGTILMGMGMPTTSAYIMSAILLAPALIQLGFDPLASHMLVFYFAILAMVTPPIALSAYAAATISKSPPGEVGWAAFRLAAPVMLIPVVMILRPAMLLRGTPTEILVALLITLLTIVFSCAASVGWLYKPLRYWQRGLAVFCALCFVATLGGAIFIWTAILGVVALLCTIVIPSRENVRVS